jgi:hypothetical protein
MKHLTLASFESPGARFSFRAVVVLRCLFFCAFVYSLHRLINLGTSPLLVSFGAALGVVAVSQLAFTNLTHRGFFTLLVLGYFAYRLLLLPLNLLAYSAFFRAFLGFDLSLHLDLIIGALAIAGLSTWAFWKFRHALTLEILGLSIAAVYLFAGHRNFHFDTPQIIHRLAWALKVQQLSTLIGIGTVMVIAILSYVYFATLPGKPAADIAAPRVRADAARPNLVLSALIATLFIGLFYAITTILYTYYNEAAATRAANGVGEATNEGMTPLGFHSALGSTNQPAALVRLEGDYKENPFLPMMYMRESALSQFNGRELAIANRTYDQDVSSIAPGEAYRNDEDTRLLSRVPLAQSIYLLTEHKLAFAVDYPTSIVGLKNPNPSRFKGAFRAYSMAPGFSLQSLADQEVGDPAWSQTTRDHYLYPHPDHRYAELAEQISEGVTRPVEKAAAIVQYLSKNAIYTLTPNHEVKPDEDPVAPFLFGDKRGYCVHFAHATVYMLRALGIPARIGTGYLTDLSQAKDGHILLRMSDRHAWAEVYVTNHGWIPFDTQPEQVENHADTQVDMKVLEELMGLLDPGEEILPKDITKDEAGAEETHPFYTPNGREFFYLLALLVTLMLMTKAYLRFGWLLPGDSRFKLRRSYIAVLSWLHDLGYRRDVGETREEFRARIERQLGAPALSLARLHLLSHYAAPGADSLDANRVSRIRRQDFKQLSQLHLLRRVLAAINPSSSFASLMGLRW